MTSSDVEPSYDVVIVGSGPVGLSAAIALSKAGLNTLILEKNAELAKHSRAPGIWARTMEFFADIGVVEAFLKHGIVVTRLSPFDVDRNKVLLTLPLSELKDVTSFPQLTIVPQDKTERILLDHLRSLPRAEHRFSSRVYFLKQDKDSVLIKYESHGKDLQARGSFVLGCDGAHSFVREAIGAKLEGETYPFKVALADIVFPSRFDGRFPRISTRHGLHLAIRIDDKLWRLILPFSDRDKRQMKERIDAAVSVLFTQRKYEVLWQSEFNLHRRLSSFFAKGRVVLAGDAAHLNSPVGGQGMNSGIQDIFHLRQSLLQAVADCNPKALESYGRTRRIQVGRGVNRYTHFATKILLGADGRFFRIAFTLLSYLVKIPMIRRQMMLRSAMLR
jgi:3-(3-hydroxy-phenyl)propionate hydroxylase